MPFSGSPTDAHNGLKMGSRFNPSDEKANCFLGFNPPDGAEEQNDARWGARKACTDLFDLKEESLVPGGGVEPPRSEDRRILSLSRIP